MPKPIDWDLYHKKFPRICRVCGGKEIVYHQETVEVSPIGPVNVSYWDCPGKKEHGKREPNS